MLARESWDDPHKEEPLTVAALVFRPAIMEPPREECSLFMRNTYIASGTIREMASVAVDRGLGIGDRYMLQVPGKEVELQVISRDERAAGKKPVIAIRNIPKPAPILASAEMTNGKS